MQQIQHQGQKFFQREEVRPHSEGRTLAVQGLYGVPAVKGQFCIRSVKAQA